MIRILLSVSCIIVFTLTCWSRPDSYTDSLRKVLPNARGTHKVDILLQLGDHLSVEKPIEAKACAERSLSEARTLGYTSGTVRALNLLAVIYHNEGRVDLAYQHYVMSMELLEQYAEKDKSITPMDTTLSRLFESGRERDTAAGTLSIILLIATLSLFAATTAFVILLGREKKKTRTMQRLIEQNDAIDRMARIVTAELHLDTFLRSLSEKVHSMIPGADRVSGYAYDSSEDGFKCVVAYGAQNTLRDAGFVSRRDLTDLVHAGPTHVGEDIYMSRFEETDNGDPLWGLSRPMHRLLLLLKRDSRIEALLVVDSFERGWELDKGALDGVLRLRALSINMATSLRLIEEMRTEKKRAEHLNLVKTELLGIASHDLKNPLGMIIGYAELMETIIGEDGELTDMTRVIQQEGRRMLDLIIELLDTTALEMGKLELDLNEVNVAKVALSSIAVMKLSAERKSQKIHFSCTDEDNCVAIADEKRLRQVVENLLSNAIKYSPLGKTIWVKVSRNGRVRFEIRDEGPGISVDEQTKLFERFRKLSNKTTGGEHSAGVGLSIVKQIIDLHGGKIWVESESGKGSTFFFEL